MAGYSETPLAKKLGFPPATAIYVVGAPEEYEAWLGSLPEGATLVRRLPRRVRAAHVFVTRRSVLESSIAVLRPRLEPNGLVWISWPKKASKVPTDVTEDTVREVVLPTGLVDVKVCAVSDVYSGLKLVVRKELRE